MTLNITSESLIIGNYNILKNTSYYTNYCSMQPITIKQLHGATRASINTDNMRAPHIVLIALWGQAALQDIQLQLIS